MARGITQDQVNQAADTILAAGENPTVEKVRAALGTGSPNTITRMLDSWRSQLGKRLRQLSTLPDVPDPVGQAMVEVWRLAVEHAQRSAEAQLAKYRSTLEAERSALTQERQHWVARLETAETEAARANAAKDLAEHVCANLDGQLQDSHALRADILLQRDRLQSRYDQAAAQIQGLQAQLDEARSTLEAERERLAAHVRTTEDRAHQEVDRARQETKRWQQQYELAERTHQEAIRTQQTRHDAIVEHAQQSEKEMARQAGQIQALERAITAISSVASKKGGAKTGTRETAKRNPPKDAAARPATPRRSKKTSRTP
ncbi:Chromosome partition protein Smc [Dyella sp. AD56]|uniref:DNA-binding protein n=1 Tax=Dyella sp. AD56 TaxID=1528744 RepID=UPI000C849C79|nr:DNA-binding protein [Dyella sp. AD56]PMQ03287.1 Chromosome partition protein Smc [Dyella sp. AD56]